MTYLYNDLTQGWITSSYVVILVGSGIFFIEAFLLYYVHDVSNGNHMPLKNIIFFKHHHVNIRLHTLYFKKSIFLIN